MKSLKPEELGRLAAQSLFRCLDTVPFLCRKEVDLEPLPESAGPDFLARLLLPGSDRVLLVEVKGNGEPRKVRDAANRLFRFRDAFPGAYGVIIAPYISPRSAQICAEEGIGYVDMAGNCRLAFDQVYIEREGRPNLFAEKRDLRSLYSPKAERVLRVLLTHPGRRWRVQSLAVEAEVSLGQSSNVKSLLADREWLRTEPEGVVLSDPGALLAEWAENYRYRRNTVRDFYSLKSVPEIESDLADVCARAEIRYALTGLSGAARLAPFVRYPRVTAYVATEEYLARLAQRLGLKTVASGANVSLLLPYDEGVFYGAQTVERDQIVAPVQCYLDVRSVPGRGQEAADALLREALRPQQ
jgi:hypothetical protein